MKVTDLLENEAILCSTEEECNKILDLMHEAWLKWANWNSYEIYRNMDHLNEWQCYFPKDWCRCDKNFSIAQWLKIYNASEFFEEHTLNWESKNEIELVIERIQNKYWFEDASIEIMPKRFRI